MKPVLFLDFDGVLHPLGSDQPFTCRPHLIALLERAPSLQIVISSAWRLDFSLAELRQKLFPEPDHQTYANRIIDTLPFFADFPKEGEPAFRLREALAWGDSNSVGRWVCLDDKPGIWFKTAEERARHAGAGRVLVVCDSGVGMTLETVEAVVRVFGELEDWKQEFPRMAKEIGLFERYSAGRKNGGRVCFGCACTMINGYSSPSVAEVIDALSGRSQWSAEELAVERVRLNGLVEVFGALSLCYVCWGRGRLWSPGQAIAILEAANRHKEMSLERFVRSRLSALNIYRRRAHLPRGSISYSFTMKPWHYAMLLWRIWDLNHFGDPHLRQMNALVAEIEKENPDKLFVIFRSFAEKAGTNMCYGCTKVDASGFSITDDYMTWVSVEADLSKNYGAAVAAFEIAKLKELSAGKEMFLCDDCWRTNIFTPGERDAIVKAAWRRREKDYDAIVRRMNHWHGKSLERAYRLNRLAPDEQLAAVKKLYRVTHVAAIYMRIVELLRLYRDESAKTKPVLEGYSRGEITRNQALIRLGLGVVDVAEINSMMDIFEVPFPSINQENAVQDGELVVSLINEQKK